MGVSVFHPYKRHEKYIVPVPSARRVPATAASVPFNAAIDQADPMDLAALGYLEEEYFLSGEANVYARYDYGDDVMVKVQGAPYTFRILARKSANPAAFSGNVIVEIMNYAGLHDVPGAWGELDEYLIRNGDAWVGVTVRDVAFDALKTFDPGRYAELNNSNPLPPEKRGAYIQRREKYGHHPDAENGLMNDALSQIATLCRDGGEGGPFHGYRVERMFATGASAGNLSAYAGSVHNYAMRDEEHHVYDGFLLKMTSSTAQLNNEEPDIAVPDPRSVTRPEVPMIRIITMGDLFGVGVHTSWAVAQRRPDADEPLNNFRLYETPGTRVANRLDKNVAPGRASIQKLGKEYREPEPPDPYLFPCQYITRAALDHLKKWVRGAAKPPYADRVETTGGYPDAHPDRSFVLDGAGNIQGGVRSPMVDVPIAAYKWDGAIAPFGREELIRRYGSRMAYLERFADSVRETVEKGFLLPEDGLELLTKTIHFDFGFDW